MDFLAAKVAGSYSTMRSGAVRTHRRRFWASVGRVRATAVSRERRGVRMDRFRDIVKGEAGGWGTTGRTGKNLKPQRAREMPGRSQRESCQRGVHLQNGDRLQGQGCWPESRETGGSTHFEQQKRTDVTARNARMPESWAGRERAVRRAEAGLSVADGFGADRGICPRRFGTMRRNF